MLTQALSRHGDAATRRHGAGSQRHRVAASPHRRVLFVVIVLLASIASGCGSKPTDPRTVIPADALVYLESADLGKTVGAMTNNPKFAALAKQKPDLSVLSGVKIGIAVTGFEASEEPVTEENAVIDLQPRFVAVIETNAWGWQAKSFVENNVGEFFNNLLGGAVDLEITTRKDSEYYVWTSPEGRKAYALQQGSLVYFGNDESAIERCQAVKRGETDSFAKMGKVPDGERIAFGYVSPEGVGQIGNIVSILLAKSTGEEADVQSFVAQVLPEILRNTVREVTWSASESEGRIEDKLTFKLDDESSRVFNETMAPANSAATGLEGYLPDSAASVTRYLSRDPQVAWRSVVLTAQKKADATSGVLIGAFSGSLFEQYGIEDPEAFLTSVAPRLLTVRLSEDPDQVAVIATAKNLLTVNGAIAKEVPLTAPPEKQFGADLWKSGDGEFAAAFIGDVVVVGETNTVIKCLEAKQTQAGNPTQTYSQRELLSSDAVATTVGSENSKLRLVDALAERKNPNDIVGLEYKIETRFNLNGIERRTVSDFGLIGSIIEGLLPE